MAGHRRLEGLGSGEAGVGVLRQEEHPHAVPSEGEAHPEGFGEEGRGQGHEQARAVARVRVGPHGSPVVQAFEQRERVADEGHVGGGVEAGHEAEAARVVLEGGIVEAVGGGQGHRAEAVGPCPEERPYAPDIKIP